MGGSDGQQAEASPSPVQNYALELRSACISPRTLQTLIRLGGSEAGLHGNSLTGRENSLGGASLKTFSFLVLPLGKQV